MAAISPRKFGEVLNTLKAIPSRARSLAPSKLSSLLGLKKLCRVVIRFGNDLNSLIGSSAAELGSDEGPGNTVWFSIARAMPSSNPPNLTFLQIFHSAVCVIDTAQEMLSYRSIFNPSILQISGSQDCERSNPGVWNW